MQLSKIPLDIKTTATLKKYDAESNELLEVIIVENDKIKEVITEKERLREWL